MTQMIRRPPEPAPEDVLGADLLAAAAQLEGNLRSVLDCSGVTDVDAETAVGDLRLLAIRLTAVSWQRAGRLGFGSARPFGPWVSSAAVVAPRVDANGHRLPGNADAIAGAVRRLHADAGVVAGLVVWSYQDESGRLVREIAVPGRHHVVEELGGRFRAVPSGEG